MKTAEEILESLIDYHTITDDTWYLITVAMEEYAAQFKPTAEANANTVLCGVAAIDDLKCCGNCINSRHYTNLVIPESIFCCAVSAHRIKPHNMCEYWKQDNYESEQRNIDKPKP